MAEMQSSIIRFISVTEAPHERILEIICLKRKRESDSFDVSFYMIILDRIAILSVNEFLKEKKDIESVSLYIFFLFVFHRTLTRRMKFGLNNNKPQRRYHNRAI